MKQTIEIDVPDGKKAIWKDGKVVFEDIKLQLPKKHKFDPKTLKPFDRILFKNSSIDTWACSLFSHHIKKDEAFPFFTCTGYAIKYCIPYNDDTKHLVGTTEEAPEYYRYWED